ncbi:MAG: hypothetical protein GX803_06920 [Lentisphaerae bacterium]|jgi:hypothetical protein|nr:hypothetical protein [Lentisphaerota bacterium]
MKYLAFIFMRFLNDNIVALLSFSSSFHAVAKSMFYPRSGSLFALGQRAGSPNPPTARGGCRAENRREGPEMSKNGREMSKMARKSAKIDVFWRFGVELAG